MDTKKIIAVLAVLIVVFAGVGLWLSTDSKAPEVQRDYGGTLLVYGNANEDSVLDDLDIETLEKIISGDAAKTRFADANLDGTIDQKDIDYVKKLIAREDGTVINYLDGGEFNSTVTLPVERINVLYRAQQTCIAIGLDDTKVQLIRAADPVFKPKFANSVWLESGGLLDDYDAQTAPGIPDVIVTVTTPGTPIDPAIKAIYDKAGIDIVRIANMEGEGTAATALTLGFLVGNIEQSQKYAQWNVDMMQAIDDVVASIPDNDKRTGMTWMGGYFAAGIGHGYNTAMEAAGVVSIADWENSRTLNMDNRAWFYNYDPDYVIRTMGIGYSAPPEKGPSIYSTWAPVIEEMRVYKEDHFCVVDSTCPQSLRIAYIGEFVYPEYYGEGFADKWHQKLIDLYGIDVKCDGQFVVTAEDMRNLSK